MANVKLRRYTLPSVNGEGWAEIVIGSNGFFAAVSDFGNYASRWRDPGVDDFRKFLLRAERDWDYFARKLGGELAREYDGEETLKAVKRNIISERRHGSLDTDEAREEWDLLKEHEDLAAAENFAMWIGETHLGDAWEMTQRRFNVQLERFCRETMRRLGELIVAELEAEGKAA